MPVRVEHHGPVTIVVLSRPQVANAVDRATAIELADAFRAFDADDAAHVAVLCADGPSFCAGADLKQVATGEPNRVAPDGDAPMGPSRMLLSKPVVAAICGHAVAGGLELALWCDLRIADEDAVLGVFRSRRERDAITEARVQWRAPHARDAQLANAHRAHAAPAAGPTGRAQYCS